MTTLKKWLTPSTLSGDPVGEAQRIRRTLTVLLWGTLITIGSLGTLSAYQQNFMEVTVMGIMAASLIFLIFMMNRGHVVLSSWLVPLIILGGVFYIHYMDVGIRTASAIAYPMVIVTASLLLGRRATIIFTLLSYLAMTLLIVAEVQGFITSDYPPLTYSTIITITPLLLITSALIYTIMENFNKSIMRAKENQLSANQAAFELEKVKASLENTVAERTQDLEQALRDVEIAQLSLEQQAWLANGVATLSEQIYGVQNIAELAHMVVNHLCQYTDAQLGALFIYKEDKLKLMGSYAYIHRRHMINEFALGEGLVGQAGLEKKRLMLAEVPDDYVVIAGGLVTAVPRYLIALPFTYEDQLIGVIEIAYLQELSATKLEFLESALNNIAIAFNMLQVRYMMTTFA